MTVSNLVSGLQECTQGSVVTEFRVGEVNDRAKLHLAQQRKMIVNDIYTA